MLQKELFSKKVSVQLSFNQERKVNSFSKKLTVRKYGIELVIDYNEKDILTAYYQGQEVTDLKVLSAWD